MLSLKKKKNPISPIILILLLPQLVCSRFNILPVYKAQFCSRLLYHNHLARCLDSNWWIVAPRVGRVWYICSRATLFYQPHLQVTVQCSQKVVFFPPLSVCAGSEYAPVHTVPRCSLAGLVNHLPVTGGGNTTAGLAVQRWRLARCWVRCLARFRWKCGYVIFLHAGEGKKVRQVLCFFSLPRQNYPLKIFFARLLFNSRICAASVCSGAYMLVGLLVCLCVCASTRVGVLLSYSPGGVWEAVSSELL